MHSQSALSADEYAPEAASSGAVVAELEDYSPESQLVPAAEEGAYETVVGEAEPPYEVEEETAEGEAPDAGLRQRIVDRALTEVTVWQNGQRRETEAQMRPVLKAYWETLLSSAEADRFIDQGYAWSAAFVCTVMQRAGAGAAFTKNSYHTGYTASAKEARAAGDRSKFWAYDVSEAKPELGDVVVRDRRPRRSDPCGGTTFANVTSHRTSPSHGDIVVEVKPNAISVVGGNVSAMGRATGDTVARRDIPLDASGHVAVNTPEGCKYFAIVRAPGADSPGLWSTVSTVADTIASIPQRIGAVVRTVVAPAAPAPTRAAARAPGVNAKVVGRIDGHREVIERAAAGSGVSANLLRGIIAAESGGDERTGAGGSGYKGLMQSERTAEDLDPAVSTRKGAKKYVDFTQSMRRYFRDVLKQDFDKLPEETRIRIVMAAYNAGPGTVKRAMQSAGAAGDVTRWLDPEHYLRALISYGAYNPMPAVLEWCVGRGELTGQEMASDLARLSGKGAGDVQQAYSLSGKWNIKALATALRPHLFQEKDAMKNDGTLTWAAAQSRASTSLLCAARFKQAHTGGYLDTVIRYKRFYDAR